jgi:translocation and assembly module TamB
MAEENGIEAAEASQSPPRKSTSRRLVTWLGAGLAILVVIAALVPAALNTSAGRGFVRDQIAALEFENGLKIEVGAIEGSLLGVMRLQDVALSDPQGVFAQTPALDLDWSPLGLLAGHIDIDEARIEAATLERLPEFRETPPSDGPFFPDYTIEIGNFAIDRLVIEAPVTGAQRIAGISGDALIVDGRAIASLDATSIASADGAAAGDRIALTLNAVPDENRLDLQGRVSAPPDGLLAALAPWSGAFEADLAGEGSWTRWDGRLTTALDGKPTASFALSARSGTFGISGNAQLAPMAPASLSDLLAGDTRLALEARLEEPLAKVSVGIANSAFAFKGAGGVGLGSNTIDGFSGKLRVSDASVLGANVTGSDIVAGFTLDGDLSRPDITYDLAADRLAANGIGAERLSASGATSIDPENMTIPLSARAARIVGLDTATGGPLVDIRLSGDILVSWPRILSDNLQLRSRRLDARLTLLADAEKGRYGGALEGRLDDYRLESVGLFDVESGARIEADTRSGLALTGKVRARSSKVKNTGVRSLLGGPVTASSDVSYGRDGVTRLSDIRLASPRLNVETGGGIYGADGELDIEISGQSSDYGQLDLALAGTLNQPVATLTAPGPDAGIGLADLRAVIRGDGGRYAIKAKGDTDFGPLDAALTADFSQKASMIDLTRGEIGGITLSGRLEQQPEGPFAGDLKAQGRGLSGAVTLGGKDAVQIARVDLRAEGLSLPGAAGARIDQGHIEAEIALRQTPEISADIQLANARYFSNSIDMLRAQIELVEGSGSARILAEGSAGVPFRFAANADLAPDLWHAAITGNVRGIDFRTTSPARIIPGEGAYRLLPTQFAIREGSVRLAGEFGASLDLKARLDGLDLTIMNRFAPGLGISGKATGVLDFNQVDAGAFPSARARLSITGFSRSTALSVSPPVDVKLAAALSDDGGKADAVMRQSGEVVGRINSTLGPPAEKGGWVDRLLAAPLGGGVRYNGPAQTVFALLGLADQSLTGPLGLAADFSGRLQQPRLTGLIKANSLTYENQTYGTRLSGMKLNARFRDDQLVIEELTAAAGKGRVDATGTINLSSQEGFPMEIAIALESAQLARSEDLGARATGELTLTKRPGERSLLSGTLILPETRYTLANSNIEEIPELSGVRFTSQRGNDKGAPAQAAIAKEPGLRDLRLDLKLVARDELFVTGLGLNSEWSADLRVGGTTADPRLSGEVNLIRGVLGFAGRSFDIESGQVSFRGEKTFDPVIAITATERIEDVAVTIDVSGRAFTPEFDFSSSPGLPQDEIVSRILFGSSVARLSALEAVQLARSLNALRSTGGGFNPLGTLRSATGLDRLRVLGGDEAAGRGTAVAAGQYISDDIYVEVITDARGFTATQLEVSLSRTLSVLSQAGGAGGTNVNLRYRKDY